MGEHLREKDVAGLRQPEIQRTFGGRVLRIPTVYEKAARFKQRTAFCIFE